MNFLLECVNTQTGFICRDYATEWVFWLIAFFMMFFLTFALVHYYTTNIK